MRQARARPEPALAEQRRLQVVRSLRLPIATKLPRAFRWVKLVAHAAAASAAAVG
jgi:hypothetical protein